MKTAAAAADSGVVVTGRYGFSGKFHKLEVTPVPAGTKGKKINVSVNGVSKEVTLTAAGTDPTLDEIVTAINAAHAGLAAKDGTKLVL